MGGLMPDGQMDRCKDTQTTCRSNTALCVESRDKNQKMYDKEKLKLTKHHYK